MSHCIMLAADVPIPEIDPPEEPNFALILDGRNTTDNAGDDHYGLYPRVLFGNYTELPYAAELYLIYKPGRALRFFDDIRALLQKTDAVELWNLWLMDDWEWDDRPIMHHKSICIDALTPEAFHDFIELESFQTPQQERPDCYCLRIHK